MKIRNSILAVTLLAIGLGFTLSSCAIFSEAVDKIASGVEKYCEQPYTYRSDFRNTVNTALSGTGHSVHVYCAGDPPHEPTAAPISEYDALAGVSFSAVNIGVYDYATEKESYAQTTRRAGEGPRKAETHEGQKERPQESET